jgi:hypothetical protein
MNPHRKMTLAHCTDDPAKGYRSRMRNPTRNATYRVRTVEEALKSAPIYPREVQSICLTRSRSMAAPWAVGLSFAALMALVPIALIAQSPATDTTAPASAVPDQPEAGASESAKLALKLTNPVASLISIPIQNWFDFNLGPKKDGFRYTMEAQPVYPMRISKEWNLISRSTIPVVYQQNLYGRTTQAGLSDSTESLFLSPVHTKSFIWGAGPVFLIPTGTYGALSTRKFGMGPTGVVLLHTKHSNFGLLGNQVWSVAGSSNRGYVSQTYAQPFATYTTSKAWTYSMNSYDTYDWNAGRWTAIVNPIRVSKLLKLGSQRLSVGAALRCTVTSPQYQPKGCGLEFTMTPLYPVQR